MSGNNGTASKSVWAGKGYASIVVAFSGLLLYQYPFKHPLRQFPTYPSVKNVYELVRRASN
jgi:hypothetical protein